MFIITLDIFIYDLKCVYTLEWGFRAPAISLRFVTKVARVILYGAYTVTQNLINDLK